MKSRHGIPIPAAAAVRPVFVAQAPMQVSGASNDVWVFELRHLAVQDVQGRAQSHICRSTITLNHA